MSNRIPVAAYLSDADYRTLLTVYANHNSSMDFETRVNYSASHIIQVVKDVEADCLNVQYVDGSQFKYYADGTWGK